MREENLILQPVCEFRKQNSNNKTFEDATNALKITRTVAREKFYETLLIIFHRTISIFTKINKNVYKMFLYVNWDVQNNFIRNLLK